MDEPPHQQDSVQNPYSGANVVPHTILTILFSSFSMGAYVQTFREMANGIKSSTFAFFVVLLGLTAIAQQRKPDFSGTWVLDVARSGLEPEIWLQRRPVRFTIHQTIEEMTIDTGDGSLFAVPTPVTETPLRYRLDGSVVTVLDRTMGDIPNFTRRSALRRLGKPTRDF